MSVASGSNRPGVKLALSAALAAAVCLSVGRRSTPPRPLATGPVPEILPENAYVEQGAPITLRALVGEQLWYTVTDDLDHATRAGARCTVPGDPSSRHIARALSTPLAVQWRHPLPGLPEAVVVRAAEGDRGPGPFTMHTYLFQQHALPVISISTDPDGLFSAEHGIAVVGNAILEAGRAAQLGHARDPRWWKYPGNFHGRGREWERHARMQMIAADGRELFQSEVDLRINGQMTRGFPQHAFRLLFPEPLSVGPFADGDGLGASSLVLRAAGNDQVKAMLRDAYQHALCAGLPFGTSKARTCVVYINGAYFGVHHLRQRFDEHELARRHGIPAKRMTILEDQNEVYSGDGADAKRFVRLMARTEKWDAVDPAWLDTLEAQIDLDGFLTYMASQMVMGNMDWPRQNVKYWRYTGRPKAAPLDGRWYFLMGDSDLGFGANAPPSADLLVKVREARVPLSRLFLAMMRNAVLRERFVGITGRLIDGPLSTSVCLARLDSLAGLMDPEMARHTARWRKPADKAAWLAEVEAMREYARQRPEQVRRQLATFASP